MNTDLNNLPLTELVNRWSSFDDAELILGEAFKRFDDRAAIASSGQLTDVAIIDIAHKSGEDIRVYAVDPLRLHESTYDLNLRLEERYGMSLEIFQPDEKELEKMVGQHGTYLFFDSREKQELCCQVRKVKPNQKALVTLDCWITGLRRDQSASRATMPICEIIEHEGREIVKLSPLAAWSEKQVWDYVQREAVPYDPLFDPRPDGSRYRSLGCIICTTPELPHEALRAGRWRWFNASADENKKECGLHLE